MASSPTSKQKATWALLSEKDGRNVGPLMLTGIVSREVENGTLL